MNPVPFTRPECPSPEQLAAFVDGRLAGRERAEVERHVAGCELCLEIFAEAVSLGRERQGHRAEIPAGPAPRATRYWPIAVALGVAASVAAVLSVRPFGLAFTVDQRAAAALTLLAGSSGPRPSLGRLSAPFDWAPAPTPERATSQPHELPLDRAAAVLRIREAAASHRTAATLQALGIADMVSGQIDDAISNLEGAAVLDPRDASVHVDLAAAFIDRWSQGRQAVDASSALNESELALIKIPSDPCALFDKAWAWEALGDRAAALSAWQAARDADPRSRWAAEATTHINRLKESGAAPGIPHGDSASEADLALVAESNPGTMYAALDDDLARWAGATERGEAAVLPAVAAPIARALVAAHRDAVRSVLVGDVTQSRGWSRDRRDHLARAVLGLNTSHAAYSNSDYAEAETLARRAVLDARAAGVSTEPFAAQAVWARFFTAGGRGPGVSEGDALEPSAEAAGFWFDVGRLRYLHGLEMAGRARISDALPAYLHARDAARQCGAPDLLATLDSALAELMREAGDEQQAWFYHVEALALLPDLGPRLRHLVLSEATLTALHDRAGGSARSLAKRVFDNAASWNNPAGIISASLEMARARLLLDQLDEARRSLATARATLDRWPPNAVIRSQYAAEIDVVDGLTMMESAPRAAAASFASARDAFAHAQLLVRVPQAGLDLARAHRASGDVTAAKADLSQALQVFEDQRAELREEQLKISRLSELWDLYGDLIDLTSNDPTASLAVAERARDRALLDALASNQQMQPLLPNELASSVPPGTTALVYAVRPQALLVWEVRGGAVRLAKHAVSSDHVRELVAQFTREVRSGPRSGAGAELSALLLPDDLQGPGAQRLAVLPDGPLYSLPFAWLPVRGGASSLGAHVMPVVAPSLSILASLRREKISPQSGPAVLIGFGSADIAAGLPELAGVTEEINTIARLYPGAITLTGTAATPAAVLDALPRASVIHFAGHAEANDLYPSDSRLFVAPDGSRNALRPEDVARLRLRPGTVVILAGCDTAQGAVFRGEGPMNWARPFLAAGAAIVVANLWPVPDEAMAEASVELHRALRQGLSPESAVAAVYRTHGASPLGGLEMFGGWGSDGRRTHDDNR